MRLDVLNFIVVTLYGNVLMLLFTKQKVSKAHAAGLTLLYLFSGFLNLLLHEFVSNDVLYMLYPLTVHLPLLVYYICAMKTPLPQAVFALTAAYVLTTPRKWLCLLAAYALGGSTPAAVAAEIGVTAVLLFAVAKLAAPAVVRVFSLKIREASFLWILPTVFYIVTYATTVYSDCLFRHAEISIPILSTVLALFCIGFAVYFFDCAFEKVNNRHNRDLLALQQCAAERMAAMLDGGESYFCENKTVNAFLSMYQAAAKASGILFVCNCNLPSGTKLATLLAVLTAVLDDALGKAKEYIKLEALQKNGQLCLMAQTDASAVYNAAMLATLNAVAHENNGILHTDTTYYSILISMKKET